MRKKRAYARRYQQRLQFLLNAAPTSTTAIVRAEGLALLHEMDGAFDRAIKERKREIRLMKRLHKDVNRSGYDVRTRRFMLADRGRQALRARESILNKLIHIVNEEAARKRG